MRPVKTVYVPQFGSQQSSSQRTESDKTESLSQTPGEKNGNKRRKEKRAKPLSILKVKIPILTGHCLIGKVAKDNKTPASWMLEPALNDTKAAVNQGGESQCSILGAGTAVADGDVFFFSQRSSGKATNEKEKAKHFVLRTISKMLKENQLIRQRLDALTKAK